MLKDLRESLEQHPVPLLRAIAAGYNLDVSRVPRSELPRVLAEHITHPETVAWVLELLTPEERAVLDRLIAEGGAFPAHRITREYGAIRELGAGRLERERPWEHPISPTERLWYLGLIHIAFGVVGEFRGRICYIPSDVLPLLPPVETPPVQFSVDAVSEPPHVRAAGLAFVEDAFVVLSEIQQHPMPPLDGRYLPPKLLARINARLRYPEPHIGHERETHRLGLLLHLLRGLRLIETDRRGLLHPALARARRWLEAPRVRRLLSLQRAWAADQTWNELWRVPELRFERTGWRNDPFRTRRRVLHWLAQVPLGTWVSVESFVAAIKRVDPDFQRPTGDYESWYIRDARTGRFLRGWESWDEVEGRLLRYFLRGPLQWLNIVEVGYDDTPTPQAIAFRITPEGAAFLGHTVELPAPPPRRPVRIEPDGTILVPDGADDWERLHLERLSVPVEPPHRYRLDRERVVNVLLEGSHPERIIAFLRHTADNRLPSEVEERFWAWVSGFGRMRMRRVVLLEVDSPELLEEVRRLPHIRPFIREVLNRRTVVVDEEHADNLIAALRRAGYLPRVEEW